MSLRSPSVLALLAAASCAPPPTPNAVDPFDAEIEAAIADEVVPGAVLLVARRGEIVLERAYGHARLYDYGRARTPSPVAMEDDTVFDLASLTKVFATTFGVMLLVDRGAVELDEPLHTYLPEFRGGAKDQVTLRHLLTHTAGLTPWKPTYYHADSAEEAYRVICELPLAYPVGEERHYSDLGFMLLGYLIESVGDRPLDVFVAEELYRPLGLETTTFLPRERGITGFAATSHGNPFEKRMVMDDDFGYVCDEDPDAFTGWRTYVLDGEVNDGNAFHAHGGVAGHAGLFSTARELHVLMALLLDGGQQGGQRIVDQRTVDAFLTPDATGSGLGWAMSADLLPAETLPAGAFGHTGFTGTYALAVPSDELVVILLTNRQNLDVQPDGNYASVDALRREVTALALDLAH